MDDPGSDKMKSEDVLCISLAAKDKRKFAGYTFDLVVYRAEEDGHLREYISSGGFSERIVQRQ